MDLSTELLVFAAVVEAGSFSAAAKRLGLAKSSVSKRVHGLESRYGIRLIQRTTRQLRVTDEGMALYRECQPLQQAMAAAEARLSGLPREPRGRLRVSAPPLFSQAWLAPMVPEFLARYPEVELELHLTESRSDPVREGYDLLIRLGEQPDSSMVSQRLTEFQPVVCAAPAYLARHGSPRTPAELAHHNCLLWQPPGQPVRREWVFHQHGRVAVTVRGNFISNDSMSIRRAVSAGQGIAFMPDYLLEDDLVPLLTDCRQDPIPVYLLYEHRTRLSASQRAFINQIKAFAQRKAGEVASRR